MPTTTNDKGEQPTNEGGPCAVPLVERLLSVPKGAREMIEVGRFEHRNIPYGAMCHEAAAFIADLTRQLTEAKREQPINTHRRLFDLVRNCRAQLHEEDLITDDEYAWLCTHEFKEDKGKSGSPSPRRLEDYDSLRRQSAALQERVGELEGALKTTEAELVTLIARLPNPYAKNIRSLIESNRATLTHST